MELPWKKFINTFLKQYAVNDEYLRAAISSTIDILSKKGIIERYVSK